MRRTKTGVLPSVDFMEPRLLLSTAAPLLSKHALSGVVREVRAIVGTLARTNNTVQASAQLTGLASQIPSGSLGSPWRGRATSGSFALIPRGRSSRRKNGSSATSTVTSRAASMAATDRYPGRAPRPPPIPARARARPLPGPRPLPAKARQVRPLLAHAQSRQRED